jgi:hypothetical protein
VEERKERKEGEKWGCDKGKKEKMRKIERKRIKRKYSEG